ncbi:MAG: D-inositol-3-phosphate glycosyltransferase [Acidimicrobiales bacterium]|nr:D-inositol-3-phosphate glycosyltransferase [Acidimicrobiales bacterium]
MVAVNLLWLVPGVVGGSEGLLVAVLEGVADLGQDDLDIRLLVQDSLTEAHPRLIDSFQTYCWHGSGANRARRVVAENTWLRRRATGMGASLIHHAGGIVPPVPRTPCVVTIHDLQPLELPQNFGFAKRAYISSMVGRSARAARVVMTPSEFTRMSVIDRLRVDPTRVVVVPHGVHRADREEDPAEEVLDRYGIVGSYFLYPAITYPHKNHATLLRAFAWLLDDEPDLTLVLTGGEGPSERDVVGLVDSLGLGDRVRRPGRVPDEDLDALYRGATGVVFPSRYEGFGLPVLEAMSRGSPVVVAAAGALPEVVGEELPRVAPDDVAGWADAMRRLVADAAHRRRMGELALERSATFSWERSAAGLLGVYRRGLEEARA